MQSGVVAAANFLLLPCLVLSGCMLRARWSLQARHAERRAARAARKRQGASFAALPAEDGGQPKRVGRSDAVAGAAFAAE